MLKEKSFKSETEDSIFRKRLSKTCQNLSPTFFSNFFYFSFTLLALANHVLHNFFQSEGGKMFQMQLKRALYHLKWCQSCTKSSFTLRSPKWDTLATSTANYSIRSAGCRIMLLHFWSFKKTLPNMIGHWRIMRPTKLFFLMKSL